MTQPTDSLDVKDLVDVAAGGLVREDVLRTIYGQDKRPTPFLDAIGTSSFSNSYHEWVEDELITAGTPGDSSIVYSSGTDYTPTSAAVGARKGNHAQINRRGVNVTDRGEGVDNINNTLAIKTMRALKNLRVDQEAHALSNVASVRDNPGTTVGKTAGLGAIISTNTSHGAGSGAVGGFDDQNNVFDAPTPGNKRDLTWTMISTQIEACYLIGAKPTLLLSRPEITKRIGTFLVETKKVQFTANVSGTSAETMVSNQYVDFFKTDFGYTMKLEPDLWQPTYTAGDTGSVAVVFGIDPTYFKKASLYGTRVKVLPSNGDYSRKMVQEDWMLEPTLERSSFAIFDITPTGAVTA